MSKPLRVVDTSVGKVLLEKFSDSMWVSLHNAGLRRPIRVSPTEGGFLVGDVMHPDSTVEQAIEAAASKLAADREKRRLAEEGTKPWLDRFEEYWE